jgi:hypothetical protein
MRYKLGFRCGSVDKHPIKTGWSLSFLPESQRYGGLAHIPLIKRTRNQVEYMEGEGIQRIRRARLEVREG